MADIIKVARHSSSSTLPVSVVSGCDRRDPASIEGSLPPTSNTSMVSSDGGDGASPSKKEPAAPDKPLALRKTPRAAAGSNMYRGKVLRRTSSAKSLDTSTAETGSPTTDVKSEHANSSAGPIATPAEVGVPAVASASGAVAKKTAASSKKRKRTSKTNVSEDVRSPHNESGSGKKRTRKQGVSSSRSCSPRPPPRLATIAAKCAKDKPSEAGDENAAGKSRHDEYCWLCHYLCADGGSSPFACDLCPRSYHAKCFGGQATDDTTGWICPECRAVLRAENTDTRSPAMQILELEQLCSLLKFALARMKVLCPVEFLQPVDLTEFPTYRLHVVHPMDLGQLETNLQHRMYGSTESFLADAKWLLHNCVVFNGLQHKLSQVAKALLKVCRQEMAEIEVCPDCYRNAHTKRGNWFVETCNLPHLLIWAKLKGFPFWPGKAMRIVSGSVDVRFFGAHDRAWISLGQCYLLSRTPPTVHKNKKRMFDQSMDELESHIRRLKERFGAFEYAPLRAPLMEKNVVDDVRAMLPQLEDPGRIERFMVGPTKQKCEEGITGDSSNHGEDNASDSASRGSLVQAVSRPQDMVRNLGSTIERLLRRRKKKAKKSSSGDDESASVGSNFAPSRSEANSVSGESNVSKPERVLSTLSNAASESTSCDRAENDGDVEGESETRAPSASNDTASEDDDNSNKANDESEDCKRNGGNDDASGSDNDEEGGLVIDTSTDDDDDNDNDNDNDDETEGSKPDAVEERVSPISSQASGKEANGENENENEDDEDAEDPDADAEEPDAKEDVEPALPVLKRYSRSDGLSKPGDESSLSADFDGHSKKNSVGVTAAKEERQEKEDAVSDQASVQRLRKELERVKWEHRQEMAEARHNADLVLLEMRRSLEAERERELSVVRRRAEAEKARAVRDTKRRQWCVVCLEEASLMCCWNTHYCDYPCQRKHWPMHVGTCPRAKSPNLKNDKQHVISGTDRIFH